MNLKKRKKEMNQLNILNAGFESKLRYTYGFTILQLYILWNLFDLNNIHYRENGEYSILLSFLQDCFKNKKYNITTEGVEHQLLCNQIKYYMIYEEKWEEICKKEIFKKDMKVIIFTVIFTEITNSSF